MPNKHVDYNYDDFLEYAENNDYLDNSDNDDCPGYYYCRNEDSYCSVGGAGTCSCCDDTNWIIKYDPIDYKRSKEDF